MLRGRIRGGGGFRLLWGGLWRRMRPALAWGVDPLVRT